MKGIKATPDNILGPSQKPPSLLQLIVVVIMIQARARTSMRKTIPKKKQFIKRIIGIEIIGFLSAILIIWIDELADLPHVIFGVLATPVNYSESAFESAVIGLLGVVIILLTHGILQRLNYLEGILPVCSFCNKIRSNEAWIPIEDYISQHSEADFSHSVCPQCAEANYGDLIKDDLGSQRQHRL